MKVNVDFLESKIYFANLESFDNIPIKIYNIALNFNTSRLDKNNKLITRNVGINSNNHLLANFTNSIPYCISDIFNYDFLQLDLLSIKYDANDLSNIIREINYDPKPPINRTIEANIIHPLIHHFVNLNNPIYSNKYIIYFKYDFNIKTGIIGGIDCIKLEQINYYARNSIYKIIIFHAFNDKNIAEECWQFLRNNYANKATYEDIKAYYKICPYFKHDESFKYLDTINLDEEEG